MNILRHLYNMEGNEKDILDTLLEKQSKDDIVQEIENTYGIKYVNPFDVQIYLKDYDIENLFNNKIIIFSQGYIINNFSPQNKEKIKLKYGEGKFYFAFEHEIIMAYRNVLEKTEEQKTDSQAENFVTEIIEKGIELGASDIHFEPKKYSFQIRFRIDGKLNNKQEFYFDQEYISNIISVIKIRAEMNIAEKRNPQDGRIRNIKKDKDEYDIRVSTTPTTFGEKIVMRLLNKTQEIHTLKKLGFDEKDIDQLNNFLRHNFGMIFIVGATGSGKTTTLYSMLNTINNKDINIYTIEDPVEIVFQSEAINQIEVNEKAGITFPNVLRSILRQDPDVISIGEIRDSDTADLAVRASLTGHLVISSVHANNSIESVERMINLGVDPFMLATSSLGFISQKLIRKNCYECSIEYNPSYEEKELLNKIKNKYNNLPDIDKLYKSDGCYSCDDVGLKGRTVVPEILTLDDELKKDIGNKKISKEKALERNCYFPFDYNAYLKLFKGEISLKEVVRTMHL